MFLSQGCGPSSRVAGLQTWVGLITIPYQRLSRTSSSITEEQKTQCNHTSHPQLVTHFAGLLLTKSGHWSKLQVGEEMQVSWAGSTSGQLCVCTPAERGVLPLTCNHHKAAQLGSVPTLSSALSPLRCRGGRTPKEGNHSPENGQRSMVQWSSQSQGKGEKMGDL